MVFHGGCAEDGLLGRGGVTEGAAGRNGGGTVRSVGESLVVHDPETERKNAVNFMLI